MDDAKTEVLAFTGFPRAHWQKIWSPTRSSGSTRRSSADHASWGSSPTKHRCSDPSAPCSPTCTTNGKPPTAATSPKAPWPSSTPSAILTTSPSSTAATDTEDQPRIPTTPRGTAREPSSWRNEQAAQARRRRRDPASARDPCAVPTARTPDYDQWPADPLNRRWDGVASGIASLHAPIHRLATGPDDRGVPLPVCRNRGQVTGRRPHRRHLLGVLRPGQQCPDRNVSNCGLRGREHCGAARGTDFGSWTVRRTRPDSPARTPNSRVPTLAHRATKHPSSRSVWRNCPKGHCRPHAPGVTLWYGVSTTGRIGHLPP